MQSLWESKTLVIVQTPGKYMYSWIWHAYIYFENSFILSRYLNQPGWRHREKRWHTSFPGLAPSSRLCTLFGMLFEEGAVIVIFGSYASAQNKYEEIQKAWRHTCSDPWWWSTACARPARAAASALEESFHGTTGWKICLLSSSRRRSTM